MKLIEKRFWDKELERFCDARGDCYVGIVDVCGMPTWANEIAQEIDGDWFDPRCFIVECFGENIGSEFTYRYDVYYVDNDGGWTPIDIEVPQEIQIEIENMFEEYIRDGRVDQC